MQHCLSAPFIFVDITIVQVEALPVIAGASLASPGAPFFLVDITSVYIEALPFVAEAPLSSGEAYSVSADAP